LISQLNEQEKVSFLIAEQNINVALKHADYGYVLDTGKVVLQDNAAALLQGGHLQDVYLGRKR
jgi:branched-chain amino acid transport system ATP-binding protein